MQLTQLYNHTVNLFSRLDLTEKLEPPPFLALPNELLVEVLKYLDSRTLLTVKLSCRDLYRAMKSRQLWYNFIQDIQELPGSSPPEEPLENYTVEELEKWVLRRFRVREQGLLPNLPTFDLRQVDNTAPLINDAKLLPGGRWMVGTSVTGFHILDLEAHIPISHLLIEPEPRQPGTRAGGHRYKYAIWIDPSKPQLTFRVALFNDALGKTRIRIYEAELQGHGTKAVFVSKCLATMWNAVEDKIKIAALDGENYIELNWTFGSVEPHSVELHLYPYSRSGDTTEIEPRKFRTPLPRAENIYIVSPNHLGVMSLNHLHIFSYTHVKENAHPNAITPMHRIPLIDLPALCESPFYTASFTYFVGVNKDRDLMLVHVPHETSRPPIIKQINHKIPSDRPTLVAIGPSSVIFFHEDHSFDRISYLWDEKNDDYSISHKCGQHAFNFFKPHNFYRTIAFDDTICRIVLNGFPFRYEWAILDVTQP